MRISVHIVIVFVFVNLCVALPIDAEAQAQNCTIPSSGTWPPCATGGENHDECVIPASGPWPPCATDGASSPPPQTTTCDIPISGAWPPCATGGSPSTPPSSPAPAPVPTMEQGRVTRIVDGDTFDVDINGQTKRVRLLGIDTTERGQRCYAEGSDALRNMIGGKWVSLTKDVSELDRYGRLLRYVYNGNQFVNREMVKQGIAYADSHPPDVKYAAEFDNWESHARNNWIGCLWKNGQPAPDCHPSYPDVCIPSPPPDLDCDDIPHKNIRVVGSDPHRLDGDNDGIGCER